MTDSFRAMSVIVVAVALDLGLGDPPNRWHPVAWLGQLLRAASGRVMHGSPRQLRVMGAAVTLGVAAFAWAMAVAVMNAALYLGPAGLLLEAVALKSLLALRGRPGGAEGSVRRADQGEAAGAPPALPLTSPRRELGALPDGIGGAASDRVGRVPSVVLW